MSIPASFRLAGANLFFMICTEILMPVACISTMHWYQHKFDVLSWGCV
jgi:hypothetical protein